jgi:hypothetical protein
LWSVLALLEWEQLRLFVTCITLVNFKS